MSDSLKDLLREILAFRDERDWRKFHTPRNIATALGIEVAELQETMLWKDDAEVRALLNDVTKREGIVDEVADILIYTLLFIDAANIDAAEAIRKKLLKNSERYPVEKSRGNATKYTNL
jgi:NTP pyrophosphatase (non-canonical NTP hydrolase)